jgi:hypothetical protein
MPTVAELERRVEIESGKLDVAESLGLWLAGFAALSVHLKWESWLFTGTAFVMAYALAISPYKARHASAKGAAHRARTGAVPTGDASPGAGS